MHPFVNYRSTEGGGSRGDLSRIKSTQQVNFGGETREKERGKGSLEFLAEHTRATAAREIASLCPPTCLASSRSIRRRNWEKLPLFLRRFHGENEQPPEDPVTLYSRMRSSRKKESSCKTIIDALIRDTRACVCVRVWN